MINIFRSDDIKDKSSLLTSFSMKEKSCVSEKKLVSFRAGVGKPWPVGQMCPTARCVSEVGWNTAIPICLSIVSGSCAPTPVADLRPYMTTPYLSFCQLANLF